MNPADLDAGGGDAARRERRRAETEARLTDSLVAEAVERAFAAGFRVGYRARTGRFVAVAFDR